MSTFTKEQMAFLATFEDRMESAYRAQWCRAMMAKDYEAVWQLWHEVSGENLEHHANCGSCVLTLMSRVGAAYFKQKEADARVQVTKTKATTKRSVKVKT